MLPNPNDTPARFLQQTVDPAVDPLIAENFFPPERRVLLRPRRVRRTTMPETPVNKHDQPLTRKNKIRFASETVPPSPASNPMRSKNRNQPQLGVLVAGAADERHHLRPLGFGEDIRHGVAMRVAGCGGPRRGHGARFRRQSGRAPCGRRCRTIGLRTGKVHRPRDRRLPPAPTPRRRKAEAPSATRCPDRRSRRDAGRGRVRGDRT